MANVPHYENGEWHEGADWLDQVWEDDSGISNEKSGLDLMASLGHGDGFYIDLYGQSARYISPDSGVPPYVIEISGASNIEYLSAGTIQDAMTLMGQWAPVATAYMLSEIWREL